LQQLARTDTYAELGKTSETVTRALAESGKEQAESLAETIDKIVGIATVIPLDAKVIKHSLAVQLRYGLPPQDSVVFASIDQFFEEQGKGPKLFANKNRKDFTTDLVEDKLAKHNCKLLPRFSSPQVHRKHPPEVIAADIKRRGVLEGGSPQRQVSRAPPE
jgi:hypothetical protein